MNGNDGIAAVGWLVFWGAVVTGFASLIGALSLTLSGNAAAAGGFLIAAALAFGLLANIIYRS